VSHRAWKVAALVVAAVCGTSGIAAAQATPVQPTGNPGYRVGGRTVLGGDGGWDYLTPDTAAHRLYITRGTHVQVVSLDSLKLLGDIPNTEGVHGVALVPSLGRGYTSNGRANAVTVFDLRTLAAIKTIGGTGRNPDAIIFEPVTRRVFTMNGGSGDATAIDVATDSIVGTIPLFGKPEFAVADGTGNVFVNNEDSSTINELDARTLRVLHTWSIAPCEGPSGLAMDVRNRRLFSVCGNGMMAVVDANSGRLITTLPIGQGSDGVKFDPRTMNAFSSNGEGTMTVVHEDAPDRFTVRGNVTTQRGARTLGLDERTGKVYTVSAEYGPTPAPTAERPRPRPPMVPGTFTLLVVEPSLAP
jgi:DNA-binding beta-propeller fold protein YncE